MTTALKEKETAEIKADNRIDTEDIQVCQEKQKIYENGRCFLVHLVQDTKTFQNKQAQLLNFPSDSLKEWNYFASIFPTVEGVLQRLREWQNIFVEDIVSYFIKKYYIRLCYEDIISFLIPKCPKKLYFEDLDNPEVISQHQDSMKAYEQNLCNLRLSYEVIVDQIFVQTGGMSLQEKALSQLKENASSAIQDCKQGDVTCERKKDTLIFSDNACCFSRAGQRYWLPVRMQAVAKALAHFEYDTLGVYGNFSVLLCDSFSESVHVIAGKKIEKVKCFKNGRVNITFTSETYAQEFAETYLGTEESVLQFSANNI